MDVFLKQLKVISKNWGGEIIQIEYPYDLTVIKDPAPFSAPVLGVDWDNKKIYFLNYNEIGPVNLIHEMGHIFASLIEPTSSTEWDFFGWEYLLALQIGLSESDFFYYNSDYQVFYHDVGRLNRNEKDTIAISTLNNRERKILIDNAIIRATTCGVIVNNKPIAIR